MKKFLLFALSFLPAYMMASGWDGQTIASSFAGGDGTEESPYLISTAEQLAKLAADLQADPTCTKGVFYKMTTDITFNDSVFTRIVPTSRPNEYADYPADSSVFKRTPIIGGHVKDGVSTYFEGSFDGSGHTISGLYVWDQSITYVGLFSMCKGASIRNLRITDSYFLTNAQFGVLAGQVIDSELLNCGVDSSYSEGGGSKGGLLAGTLEGTTTMQNCYAEGWVFGKNDMGGLVGRIGVRDGNSCVVNNCFSYVYLRVKRRNNGSLAFDIHANAQVDNCYWIALEEAKQPVWTGAELLGENIRQLTAEEFASEDLVNELNREAANIPDACHWKVGERCPVFDTTNMLSIRTLSSERQASDVRKYNLQGQRVGAGYKGLMICDGKLMLK